MLGLQGPQKDGRISSLYPTSASSVVCYGCLNPRYISCSTDISKQLIHGVSKMGHQPQKYYIFHQLGYDSQFIIEPRRLAGLGSPSACSPSWRPRLLLTGSTRPNCWMLCSELQHIKRKSYYSSRYSEHKSMSWLVLNFIITRITCIVDKKKQVAMHTKSFHALQVPTTHEN